MPTSAGTTASDVQAIIDTDLAASDIDPYLDDAEFDNQQANDTSSMTTAEIQQLEKYLAALKIVQSKSRQVSESSTGDSSLAFEGDAVSWLKSEVSRRDPSGKLATQLVRDTNRYTGTTSPD